MGYLDGTFSGVISAQTDFGTVDEIDGNGVTTNKAVELKTIIRNAVHEFGGEPYHNIVIKDLDAFGYELWDYRGDVEYPMYYFYLITKDDQQNEIHRLTNMTLDGEMSVGGIALRDIPEQDLYTPESIFGQQRGKKFNHNGYNYYISKVEYGETAGYHKTPLTYAGELICQPGENIANGVLNKVRDMLGQFEYFYDLDGRFRFQKKPMYVQGLMEPANGSTATMHSVLDKYAYKFDGNSMVVSCSNSPAIGDIKNDFTVWGAKKTSSSDDIPIHARYVVAHKPAEYTTLPHYKYVYLTYLVPVEQSDITSQPLGQLYVKNDDGSFEQVRYNPQYNGTFYTLTETQEPYGELYEKVGKRYKEFDNRPVCYIDKNDPDGFIEAKGIIDLKTYQNYYELEEGSITKTSENVDWRELLYLMARDYYQHHEFASYPLHLIEQGYLEGRTKFEPLYSDMQAFWRQLYDPSEMPNEKMTEARTVRTKANETPDENAALANITIKTSGVSNADRCNGYSYGGTFTYTDTKTGAEATTHYMVPYKGGTCYLFNTDDRTYIYDDENLMNCIGDGASVKILPDGITEPAVNTLWKTITLQFYKKVVAYGTDGWAPSVYEAPETLLYWIDFLDTYGALEEYSIDVLGHRPIAESSDGTIRSIYYQSVPQVEFKLPDDNLSVSDNDLALETLQL
jgi:hypothetical protein